jgi:hypothetical protein
MQTMQRERLSPRVRPLRIIVIDNGVRIPQIHAGDACERTTMNIRLDHTAVRLADGETISIIDGKGARVAVTRGRIWVTQEHDIRDVMLTLGQSFILDRDGTAVVEALLDAEIALDAPQGEAKTGAGRASTLTQLAVLGHPRDPRSDDDSFRRAA